MQRLILLSIAMTCLVACLPMRGDGIVSASGELTGTKLASASCQLLLADAAAPDKALDAKPVTGKFDVMFMVPPTAAIYTLSLACDGQTLATRSLSRPQQRRADFGALQL